MPGYGYSGKPTATGWGPDRIARAWDVLMKRLGYTRYVAQGGDWGAVVVDFMGVRAPSGLLGIHTKLTNTALSGARLYWEYFGKGYFNAKGVSIPVAVSVFPDELYPAPELGGEGVS